jgi:hypothetical protein
MAYGSSDNPDKRARGATWQRHVFVRKEVIKTTWTFRLVMLLLVLLLGFVTRGFWSLKLGQSLVCAEDVRPSDAILVENFEPDYLLFERARALHQAGVAARVLVHTEAFLDNPSRSTLISQGLVEVMARVARLQHLELIPIRLSEPIRLNAAYQIRDFLTKEQLTSVLIVTPAFRSQRSALVYHAVLDPAGIRVSCVPVFGQKSPTNWTRTWHGIQEVIMQFLKLQYYRWYILRSARG